MHHGNRIRIISIAAAATVAALTATALAGTPKINEIYYNCPGSDATQEYIELAGKPGSSLDGYYLIVVENENNGHTGEIGNVFNLSGMNVGSNGFAVLAHKNSVYPALHVGNDNTQPLNWAIPTPSAIPTLAESRIALSSGANAYSNRASGSGFGSGNSSSIQATGDTTNSELGTQLEGSGGTYFLIHVDLNVSPNVPTTYTDLDLGDDGLDAWTSTNARSGWTVVDQIGDIGEASELDGRLYANVNFGVGAFTGLETGAAYVSTSSVFAEHEYFGRYGEETGNTTSDWLNANLTNDSRSGFSNLLRNYAISGDHANRNTPEVFVGPVPQPAGLPYGTDMTTTIGDLNVGQIIVSEWENNGSGDWSNQNNWSFLRPNNAFAIAAFKNGLSGLTSDATVTLASGFTAGKLIFDNALHSYTLTGAGTLTLLNQVSVPLPNPLPGPSQVNPAVSTIESVVDVRAGNHFIQNNVALPFSTRIQTASSTSVTFSGTITGTTATITKTGGGLLTLGSADVAALDVQAGVTRVTGVVKAAAITLAGTIAAPTSKIDLALGGGLIFNYTTGSPLADVKTLITVGKGTAVPAFGTFAYDGLGITCTAAGSGNAAAKFNKYVVATIENSALGGDAYVTFGDLAVDGTAVLVRSTYAGDANLDGKIDIKDYSLINAAFLSQVTSGGWASGDFNADGIINADDYAIIDFGFLNGGGMPLSFGSPSSVPEPAGLSLVVLATTALCSRRRRRLE